MATLVPRVGTRAYFRLTAMLFASAVPGASKAEELGHPLYHNSDYRHWKEPGTNASCCSDEDCAPVKAEFRQGQWYALRRSEWFGEANELGRPMMQPVKRSEWIAVPNEKIIQVPNPSVEDGHLCYRKGKVVCFVPPNTGG